MNVEKINTTRTIDDMVYSIACGASLYTIAYRFNLRLEEVSSINKNYWKRFEELLEIMEKRAFDNREGIEYESMRKMLEKLRSSPNNSNYIRDLIEKNDNLLNYLRKLSPLLVND